MPSWLISLYLYTKIVVTNPCTRTTCGNGGTCYADSLLNAQCICAEGFGGKFCQIEAKTATTARTEPTTNKESYTEQLSSLGGLAAVVLGIIKMLTKFRESLTPTPKPAKKKGIFKRIKEKLFKKKEI